MSNTKLKFVKPNKGDNHVKYFILGPSHYVGRIILFDSDDNSEPSVDLELGDYELEELIQIVEKMKELKK